MSDVRAATLLLPMLNLSPSVVASWPTPNYTNPETRGPELWIVSGIFFFVATVSVWTRLYSRYFIRHWFGLDDWLILVAYISTLGVTVCVSLGNEKFDWNKHLWDMKSSHFTGSLKVLYISRIFWGVATSCVRLSILCLFYRLLERCDGPRSMRWVLHATTVFTILLLLYYLGSGILPCIPVKAYWTWPPLPQSHCMDDGLSMQIAAVMNTFSEIVIAVLPMIAIFRLRVDPRQRWSVVGLLSLSFLVAIAGICRTAFIFKLLKSYDLTWWSSPQWLTSEVEIDMALICACAAPLRPVMGRFIGRFKGNPETVQTINQKASHATLSTKGTKDSTELDYEGVATWQMFHSRTIDLEGIGEDGFGYTVTITGPIRRRKKLVKSNPNMRKDIEGISSSPHSSQLKSPHSMERKNSKSIPLQVTTEKTFQVTETFQDQRGISEKSSRSGSLSPLQAQTRELEIERAASGLGLREWEFSEAYGDFGDHVGPDTAR